MPGLPMPGLQCRPTRATKETSYGSCGKPLQKEVASLSKTGSVLGGCANNSPSMSSQTAWKVLLLHLVGCCHYCCYTYVKKIQVSLKIEVSLNEINARVSGAGLILTGTLLLGLLLRHLDMEKAKEEIVNHLAKIVMIHLRNQLPQLNWRIIGVRGMVLERLPIGWEIKRKRVRSQDLTRALMAETRTKNEKRSISKDHA